jgi:uncharacterized protein YbaP (TraB family)
MTALRRRGFDPAIGIDKHFEREATEQKKPIAELESIQYQVNLLSSFDEQTQDRLLMASLVDLKTADRHADAIVHAWRAGDAMGSSLYSPSGSRSL